VKTISDFDEDRKKSVLGGAKIDKGRGKKNQTSSRTIAVKSEPREKERSTKLAGGRGKKRGDDLSSGHRTIRKDARSKESRVLRGQKSTVGCRQDTEDGEDGCKWTERIGSSGEMELKGGRKRQKDKGSAKARRSSQKLNQQSRPEGGEAPKRICIGGWAGLISQMQG